MTGVSDPKPTAPATETLGSNTPSGPIWLELLAVLAISVVPSLSNAVLLWNFPSKSANPYWADVVDMMIVNASVIFAVLYLLSQNGERYASFGLVWPCVSDFAVGVVVFFLSIMSSRIELLLPSSATVQYRDLFATPSLPTDYVLMVPNLFVSAFREELIVRAYLITRLGQLLNSRMRAVIVAACVFASYHIYYGIGGLFQPFLDGCFYGALYLVMRRIWPFVLGHALFNIFAFVVKVLPVHP